MGGMLGLGSLGLSGLMHAISGIVNFGMNMHVMREANKLRDALNNQSMGEIANLTKQMGGDIQG